MEYSEHVGRKRHERGSSGDTVPLYHRRAPKAACTPFDSSTPAVLEGSSELLVDVILLSLASSSGRPSELVWLPSGRAETKLICSSVLRLL